MSKILVADDEHGICQALAKLLQKEGHTPVVAANGREAIDLVQRERPDAIFLDIQMPGMDGLETLARIQGQQPGLPVVIMTAYGTMETAMEAMRLGAFDYLGKPLDLDRIRSLLQRLLHRPEPVPMAAEKGDQAVAPPPAPDSLVGQSAPMQEIFKLMGLLTGNDLTVLITGESGVGKELVAKGIHRHSKRREQPFVAVNCAAIPEQLMESELFGHEKGAFTGASERRLGRCETAGEGTLFLDEIAELPYPLQGKLLRVLQEHSFERVGGSNPIPLRARLIAATNQVLESAVESGRFREDLYHRLNLVRLQIPPLRRRRDDIALLARHFLRQANDQLNQRFQDIEPSALERLKQYPWPGNVRELEHTIKRSMLGARRGPMLTVHDLALNEDGTVETRWEEQAGPLGPVVRATLRQLCEQGSSDRPDQGLFHQLVSYVEQELVAEALRMTDGNQVLASKLLGLHRSTLRKKAREQNSLE